VFWMVDLNFSAVTVISSSPVSSVVASDAAAQWACMVNSKLAHSIDTDIRRLINPIIGAFPSFVL
jgi:hypothetical protein